MPPGVATIKISGNITEALAALDALGFKAEETGGKVEAAFGDRLAGVSQRVGGVFSGMLSNLPVVGESFSRMGEKIAAADTKGQKFGATMSAVGQTMLVAGAVGVAAVAGESIHLAENFQQATAQVAASAGISMRAAQGIGNAFLSTAGQTTFSAQQMMAAYGQVAGQLAATEGGALSSSDALKVMRASTDLAEGSGTDLNTATSALSATMQAFGISTKGASAASDVLFNTARGMGVGVDTISQTVDKLHMRLGTLTPSLQDTGGLMLTLAQNGVTGSRGATMAAAGLQTLLSGSKSTTAELKTLGVKLYDSQGNFVGLRSVMDQLGQSLVNLTPQQYHLATTTLFGKSAAQTLAQVVSYGSEQLQKNAKAVGVAGSAHAAAEKQAATFKGTIEKLKATAEDLGVKFGQFLIPIITRLGEVVAGVINWFEKHKAVAVAVGIAIAVLVAGPIAMYIAGMIAAAAASIAAAAPIYAIIAVVALLGVGIYELVTHWSQVWDAIKDAAKAAWDFLKGIFDAGVNFIKAHWRDMAQLLMVITTGGIGLIPALIWRYWSQITGFTSRLWSDVSGFFARIWKDVSRSVSGMVSDVGRFFQNMWSTATRWVGELWDTVIFVFTKLPGDILNAVWHLLDDFYNFGKNLVQRIIDGIGSMAGSIGSSIGNVIKSGVNSIPGVGSLASAIGFAQGGVVTRPTLAMIGEGGETEYVIPESWIKGAWTSAGVHSLPAPGTASSGGSGTAGGGDLVFEVNGQEFARILGPAFRTAYLQGTKRNSTRVGLA